MKKKVLLVGMAAMVLAFGLLVVGCDNDSGGGGSKVTEADITVTGLSTKTGKYLSVFVYTLGETAGSPLLISAHTLISGNSVIIHATRNGSSGSIDPNGRYNIGLYFYDTATETTTGDYTNITGVQFSSAKATVPY